MKDTTPHPIPIHVLGGPTTLIEFGGLRFLTDPTFDPPRTYSIGDGMVLTKTAPSTVDPADLDPIDAVLLSHDEHPDNLDDSGRALIENLPLVLTTRGGAERLGGETLGLAPWETFELTRPRGGVITVTATPAQHGPVGCEPFTGEVIGFILSGDDLPTIYVSGDNASLEVVEQIAERSGPIDTAVLFVGAARSPFFDGALITLDGAQAAQAAAILGVHRVVPAHCDSWEHFTEGSDELVNAFTTAGLAELLT